MHSISLCLVGLMFFARSIYIRIYLIAIKMEIEEIQFLSGFDGAVCTFHSIPLYCTAFRFSIRNFKCTETLHSNTLLLFERFPFCSAFCQFSLLGWNVSNDFICNRNDTCYSEKMPLFKREKEEKRRKAEKKKKHSWKALSPM